MTADENEAWDDEDEANGLKYRLSTSSLVPTVAEACRGIDLDANAASRRALLNRKRRNQAVTRGAWRCGRHVAHQRSVVWFRFRMCKYVGPFPRPALPSAESENR